MYICRITHWKQDLFLIDTPLELVVGQRLKGTFQLERHKLWRRHLRIKLTYSLWNDEEIIIEVIIFFVYSLSRKNNRKLPKNTKFGDELS